MRIPPSVIVMSLVTAVPFGLGIRDSLKHEPAIGGEREERSRALDDYEAEVRREGAERQRRTEDKKARLDVLYGAKPAQMGSLLDGIQLGANATFQPEYIRQRIANASRDGCIR